MMEARLEGRQPIAVTFEATTLGEAVKGAAERLKGSVQSILERTHLHR